MPLQPISTIKAWFLRGKKPLQEQFWDWMDSFWHKNEAIPISSVDGLQDALDAGGSGGGVTDGDKGDIVVSAGGTIWLLNTGIVEAANIAPQAVTPAALQLVPGLVADVYEDATVGVDDKGRVVSIVSKAMSSSQMSAPGDAGAMEGDLLIKYRGNAPSFTKTSAGVYKIVIPEGCKPESFVLESNEDSTITPAGQLKIAIESSDGLNFRTINVVRQKADGRALDFNFIGQLETIPTTGTTLTEYTSIGGASGGYIISSKIV